MAEPVRLDRRHQRRLETIEQVVDVAAQVMATEGVTGLSLGEVARRMGIRPQSLYVYFDSKNALYDALYERGWRELHDAMAAAVAAHPGASPAEALRARSAALVRWSIEHPQYAPLMFWRPVPGFRPSARAYAPAIAVVRASQDLIRRLIDDGVLRADVDFGRAFRSWTALLSGVATQQLANAPQESFDSGSYTTTLPDVMDMWFQFYAPSRRPSTGRR